MSVLLDGSHWAAAFWFARRAEWLERLGKTELAAAMTSHLDYALARAWSRHV